MTWSGWAGSAPWASANVQVHFYRITPMNRHYLIEKRRPDGKLDLTPPQPAEIETTDRKLINRWFNSHPNCPVAPSVEDIKRWYEKGSGFRLREITWSRQ